MSIRAALLDEDHTPPFCDAGRGRHGALAVLEAAEIQLETRGEAAWRREGEGWQLEVPAGSWHAGRFSTPTLEELRPREPRPGRPRLSALVGVGALSDIGTLQPLLGPGVLFQAASQFNALEAPTPGGLAPVSRYPNDPTQGPRASVGAFAGTFLRHHRAPGEGGPFVQGAGRQVELLGEVTGPGVASVHNGYLLRRNIEDAEALAARLTEDFGAIRVGLQRDVEVTLGHNWGGPVPVPPIRIHQVFTSTMALGSYDGGDRTRAPDALVEVVCRQLLRAAYLGTLLAAAGTGASGVVLTLIGGGVFGNRLEWIRSAVLWACDEAQRRGAGDLDVWINMRDLLPGWSGAQLLEDVEGRRGVLVEVVGRSARLWRPEERTR